MFILGLFFFRFHLGFVGLAVSTVELVTLWLVFELLSLHLWLSEHVPFQPYNNSFYEF